MLFKLINQVNSCIDRLDAKTEAPHMLQQIRIARPDFYQKLVQNVPNKELAGLLSNALAGALVSMIKEIPTISNTMVSHLMNKSKDLALRCALAGILVYFVQPRDLIPDDTPGGYGFIDDSAMIRAGLIEYLQLLPKSAKNIEDEQKRIQFTGQIIPIHLVPALQQAIDGMHVALGLLRMLPAPMLELTLQQMINYPLQIPAIQQPPGYSPSPGPSIGSGHWSGGAYFEGGNVIISGGPALVGGNLFIPD